MYKIKTLNRFLSNLRHINNALKLSLLSLGLISGVANAATIQVTSNGDSSTQICTLRAAITTFASLNAFPPVTGCPNSSSQPFGTNDRIIFANNLSNNTVTLSSEIMIEDFDFPSGLTIDGNTNNANVTIDVNNTSDNVIISSGADLTLINLTLTGAMDDTFSSGGAVNIINGGTLSIVDSIITNNNNAGVSVSRANVIISNSTISNNIRGGSGGGAGGSRSGGGIAFVNTSSTQDFSVTVNDSLITNNTASFNGGNISVNRGSLIVNNSVISNSSAGNNGGSIEFLGDSAGRNNVNLTINNSQIFGSTSRQGGGINISTMASANIINSQITGNSAEAGGGISISNNLNNNVNIRQSDISNNSIIANGFGGGGGGILSTNTILLIDDSTITNNTVGANGGNGAGIAALTGGSLTVTNSTISGNVGGQSDSSSFRFGGGIYSIRLDQLSISDSTITNNVHTNGGGLSIRSDDTQSAVVTNNTISGNSAGVNGGGVNIDINNSANLMLASNTISNNSALGAGGGMDVRADSNGVLSFINNTVSENSANEGGGANIETRDFSSISLRSNTITGNASSQFGSGGGLNISDRSDANTFSIINTIIANSPPDLNDDCATNFGATIAIDSVSIIEDGTCGVSRNGDPGLLPLADNGGPTFTHALSPTSSAIDSGDNCEPLDQRGMTRDDPCDVGSYESEMFIPQAATDFIVIPLANGKAVVVPN